MANFHDRWGIALDISKWQDNIDTPGNDVDIPWIVAQSGGRVKGVIAKAMQLVDAGENILIWRATRRRMLACGSAGMSFTTPNTI
jgi:hypothetical protein